MNRSQRRSLLRKEKLRILSRRRWRKFKSAWLHQELEDIRDFLRLAFRGSGKKWPHKIEGYSCGCYYCCPPNTRRDRRLEHKLQDDLLEIFEVQNE